MVKISTVAEMDLAGGVACLDFVNTALDEELPVERLHSYDDLVVLVRRLGLLDHGTLTALEQSAANDPEQAGRVLQQAYTVRQSMLLLLTALVNGRLEELDEQALALFNESVQDALSERGFVLQGGRLALVWERPHDALKQAVRVFSLSAYELLTTKDQRLIKQCGACGWFFLDETKNHRRKWCDMQTCGSHQKSRRYYQRKKQASTP